MTRPPGVDDSIGTVDHLPHDVVEMLAWLLSALHSVERLHRAAHPGTWSPVDAHAAARGDLPDDRHLRSDQLDALHYMWRSVSWARAGGKNSAALVAVIHATTGPDLHAKHGLIRDVVAWRHHVVGPLDPANSPAATFARDGAEHPLVEQLRGLSKYPSRRAVCPTCGAQPTAPCVRFDYSGMVQLSELHGDRLADVVAGSAACVCGVGDRQRQTLARLAAVYRSFPGYRPEWSPS